jgi:hypothetical protein
MFFASSCDDSLDINTSPNNPASSTPELTLPVAQVAQAYTLGLDFNILAGFMTQYWTQSPLASQYASFDRYNYNSTATSTGWLHSWAWTLEDLEFVRKQALDSGKPNHAAVANFLQAYQFQVLVDLFDKIPYDEALQGKDGNLTAAYEDGAAVYAKLITKIDEGLALISDGGITPGSEDLYLNGDMHTWRKFANTLKLRIYIRQSGVDPTASQAGIQALMNSNASFLEAGENVFLAYPGTSENENPLWRGDVSSNGLGNVNISASASIVNLFKEVDDPRVSFYFDEAADGSGMIGVPQGAAVVRLLNDQRAQYATPNSNNIAGSTSPVYLITGHESLFLQAEAAALGWTSADAKALYDEAVLAAFNFTNNDGASFIASGGAYEYKGIEDIHFQKWLSMAGTQNVEAWAEFRRTDVPSLEQSEAGTGASLNGSSFPRRAFYSVQEQSNNPNTPSNGNIGDPVWWDVN